MTETAHAFLDSENIFHGLGRAPSALSTDAFAALRTLLPNVGAQQQGATGAVFRVLRDVLHWQAARAGASAEQVFSYGKNVDPAVEVLHDGVRSVGADYAVIERGRTETRPGQYRTLTDFTARVPLERKLSFAFRHTDVKQGKDEAELRLLDDVTSRARTGTLATSCLLASGDHTVMAYVNAITVDADRDRFLIVLSDASSRMQRKVGVQYARVRPDDVAVVSELRVRATKARQRGAAPPIPAPAPPAAAPTQPESLGAELVRALRGVGWAELAAAVPGTPEWDRALASRELSERASRGLSHPEFVERFSTPRQLTVAALRAGELTYASVQTLTIAAILFDATRDDAAMRIAVRDAAAADPKAGFVRHAATVVQPLLPSLHQEG